MIAMAVLDTTVRRTVSVAAPIERAFDVFTKGFTTWWPSSHHIGTSTMLEARIEPGVGGRWYEIDEDGSECDWGRVLTWEPPHELVLSWHLNGKFEYVADPAQASEVAVTFRAESPTRTVVELEHRNLDKHGETAEDLRNGIDGEGGWTLILNQYAAAV
jgi:uncharacterized protein YndB with AHSA1/START domain